MDLSPDAPVRAQADRFIDAPPGTVWSVLANLAAWPEWNPVVTRMDADSDVAEGLEFRWKAGPGTIRSVIHVVRPPHTLAWSGHTFGIRAVHIWRLSPDGSGTRVWTGETFDGVVPRLAPQLLQRTLQSSLDEWVAALKAECERDS